jgi:hypothetical protein
MALRKRPVMTRIPPLVLHDEMFEKSEVATMLGAPNYQISRDCTLLWGSGISRAPLSRPQVRTVYCVTIFRHVQACRGISKVSRSDILDFINSDEEDIWAFIRMAGGSKDDCDRGLEEIKIKRKQRRLQQETVDTQHTVA